MSDQQSSPRERLTWADGFVKDLDDARSLIATEEAAKRTELEPEEQ